MSTSGRYVKVIRRTAGQVLRLPNRAYGQLQRLRVEAGHVKRLAREPVSLAEAAAHVRARLGSRGSAFLDVAERAIFGYADSPYRPLLDAAGHDYASVKMLVQQLGVEGALRRLRDDGVFVAIEEFKGKQPARRGERFFRFHPRDFNNPLTRTGLTAASGGTRSGRIPTVIPLADHRAGAEHFALALHAYGLMERPMAVWLAGGHGASLWAIAALTALRPPSMEWFTLLREGSAYLTILTDVARLYGMKMPRLVYAPFEDAGRILRWATGARASAGCGILTNPTLALRVALEAKAQGKSLNNVTFVTIAEPLTPAKLQAIQDAGARAYSSLGFTEFGRATYGCAAASTPDESHICRDTVAVIQRRRPVDHLGTQVDSLLFTSLWPHARKILLNMETGDYAAISQRACGCPLESLGWTDHMSDIRSFEKLNAVGRIFFGSELYALIEEALPAQFGGQPTDYQLLEEEDAEGFTRLTILIHPRLGPVDEAGIVRCVETKLRGLSRIHTAVWQDAGVVRARRSEPILTKAGKLMPLHYLAASPPMESAS